MTVYSNLLVTYDKLFYSTAPYNMKLCYEIILYYSQEDEAFIAEVPELPGCAAEGETITRSITKCRSCNARMD